MRMNHHSSRFSMSLQLRRLVAGLALFGAVAAQAQWQWIDKDGRKVFSDRPPTSDVLEKNILKRPPGQRASAVAAAPDAAAGTPQAAASSPAATPGNVPKLSTVDKELEEKKKKTADAETAKRKAEEERVAKAKADNCNRAKQAKATIDSGVRIARTNEKGEREVMEDAARAAEAKRIQGVIASDCPSTL
jgi:Domain of unknown function (DUF4124)